MFPILDRLNNATRKAQRAPMPVLLRAARNGLIAFCIAVLLGVGAARLRGRIGGVIRRIFTELFGFFGGRPTRTRTEAIRDELVTLYRRGGRAKPSWVPLGAHTSSLVSTDELSGEAASAAARIVDHLYAAYFAGGGTAPDDALDEDLRTVRAWSKRRVPRTETPGTAQRTRRAAGRDDETKGT